MRWVSIVTALAVASCGGSDVGNPGDMFGKPGQIYGGQLPQLTPGQQQMLIKVNVPAEDQEPSIVTLVPPLSPNAAAGSFGFQPQELANIFAKVTWGGPIFSSAFVDFAGGVCFSMRGNSVVVEAINANPVASGIIAKQLGAFLSRGDFCQGKPKRTVVGTAGGIPISAVPLVPLAPAANSDVQLIPPFSRSVTPSVFFAVTTAQNYVLVFLDVAGNQISYYALSSGGAPADIPVPSNAMSVQVHNSAGINMVGLQLVFDINL